MRLRLLLLLLCATTSAAQANEPLIHLEHRAQLWLMSTFDAQVDPAGNGDLHAVTPRADVFFRRGRIRLAGRLPHRVDFLVQLQYDGLAQDTGTLGHFEQRTSLPLRVRDAFLSWESTGERLKLEAGYFHPRLSREAYASAFSVLSFGKSVLQKYMRDQVMGDSSGRVAGLQLTGRTPDSGWQAAGSIGLFDPNSPQITGEGLLWSPLVVGRIQLSNAEPESITDPWQSDEGVAIGLDASWQARTDVFNQNGSFGADLVGRYGPLALVLEAHGLVRSAAERTFDTVWMARVAWAVRLGERILQPVVTVTRYAGDAGGRQTSVEAATRLLISPSFSVGLAFNWSEGQATGFFTDALFFRQGSWLAVGIQHEL